jgi:hypothetical protein
MFCVYVSSGLYAGNCSFILFLNLHYVVQEPLVLTHGDSLVHRLVPWGLFNPLKSSSNYMYHML